MIIWFHQGAVPFPFQVVEPVETTRLLHTLKFGHVSFRQASQIAT